MFMMFIIAGIIPGTNITLAPIQMMILMSFLAGLVVSHAFNLSFTRLHASIVNIKLNSLKLHQLSNNN